MYIYGTLCLLDSLPGQRLCFTYFLYLCLLQAHTVSGASMLLVGYTNIKAAGPGCDIVCGETSPGMSTPREPPLGIEASDGLMRKGMEPRD